MKQSEMFNYSVYSRSGNNYFFYIYEHVRKCSSTYQVSDERFQENWSSGFSGFVLHYTSIITMTISP